MKKVFFVLAFFLLTVVECLAQQYWPVGPLTLFEEPTPKLGLSDRLSINFVTHDTIRAVLDSAGIFTAKKSLIINDRIFLGDGNSSMDMSFIPGSETTPSLFKVNIGGSTSGPGGAYTGQDPPPPISYDCVNGGVLTLLPDAVTAHKFTGTTGGNVIMGHTGSKAYIEGVGSGAATNNHRGDLFINSNCDRNIFAFAQSVPFANGSTKVMSIAGKLNVTSYMQIANASASNFQYSNTALYIYPSGGDIGLKIRQRGGPGIKLVEQTSATDTAFTSHMGTGSTDGTVRFSILADGKTQINTTNNIALKISNASTSVDNVIINKDGSSIWGDKKIISTHTHANSFMQVHGKLACKELVVLDPTKWADFVFKKEYSLMTIPELEQYYLSNNRLPDVPSEAEVIENGINIAEMNAVLLQKIEESTLYIVELNKKLETLQAKVNKLENK
jgi:hypothetical protein